MYLKYDLYRTIYNLLRTKYYHFNDTLVQFSVFKCINESNSIEIINTKRKREKND